MLLVSLSNILINAAIWDSETKYKDDLLFKILSIICVIIGLMIKLAITYLLSKVVPNSNGLAILAIYLDY